MARLSDRLRKIAERIDKGETMADIGTDHGFLPLYLLENDISPRVIMTDISEASLMKAVNNYKSYMMRREAAAPASHDIQLGAAVPASRDTRAEVAVSFRTGSGLSVIYPAEVDVVVIAGMGGRLIRDILSADMELTFSFGKYIMQPRSGQGELRKWLLENGFEIRYETLVREGRHIPEIITAAAHKRQRIERNDEHSPGRVYGSMSEIRAAEKKYGIDEHENDIIYRIPPWMVGAEGLVSEFLTHSIAKEEEKTANVSRAKSADIRRIEALRAGIEYLRDLSEEIRK